MTPVTYRAPPTATQRGRRAGRPARRRTVVSHGCTRRYIRPDGTFRVPHLSDVYAGLAAAHLRPVLDQRRALERFTAACSARRSDGRRTHEAVAFALASSMDHTTGAITAAHSQLGERAARWAGRARPYSHDTVARVIATLLAAGALVLPPGLEGKSAAALHTRYNQAPTYIPCEPAPGSAGVPAIDPDDEAAVAAEAARIATVLDAEIAARGAPAKQLAYPSRSRRERGVQVVDGKYLYEGQDRKRSNYDTRTSPSTTAERRQAADWLRSRLLIGVVPTWRLDAMLARHWRAGRTVAQVLRMVCQRPDRTAHGPLPGAGDRADAVRRSPKPNATVADVLLGCIGYRLNLWGYQTQPGRPAEPTTPVHRPASSPTPGTALTGPARVAPPAVAAATLAAARGRPGTTRAVCGRHPRSGVPCVDPSRKGDLL